MRLKVLLPSHVLVDAEARKVIAEGANGSFCLLPRHVDFVSALAPGVLAFLSPAGDEQFVAVSEGILVKCGAEVLVSTQDAIVGSDLGTLRQTIEERFRTTDEQERVVRSAVAKMEADLVRRFIELRKHGPA